MKELPIRINGIPTEPSDLKMKKYRKKPVVIDAIQVDTIFEVDTLEGLHRGNPGDYLIRGVAGEYYPCKPDIFEKTYEGV